MNESFKELADEKERELGDWWNAHDNPELTERILKKAYEIEKNHPADQADGSSPEK